jgi:hypothetical protein
MKAVIPTSFRQLGKTRRTLEAPHKRSQELALYLCIMVLIAAPIALAILIPRTTLIVIGAFLLFCTIGGVRYHRARSKLPPSIPLLCPACGSEQLEILSSGLWHGHDAEGRGTGGGFEYALCKKCGSRCVQYVDGQPFVPTEEQWKQHFEPREKHRAVAQKWPFIADDQPQANKSDAA